MSLNMQDQKCHFPQTEDSRMGQCLTIKDHPFWVRKKSNSSTLREENPKIHHPLRAVYHSVYTIQD